MTALRKSEKAKMVEMEQKQDNKFDKLMTFSIDKQLFGLKTELSKIKRS